MTDTTQLRERTADQPAYLYGRECEQSERVYAEADMQRVRQLATDWQSAYDQQAEQIRMLREALEMVLRHGRIDNSESRMNQVCKALAATEPKQ